MLLNCKRLCSHSRKNPPPPRPPIAPPPSFPPIPHCPASSTLKASPTSTTLIYCHVAIVYCLHAQPIHSFAAWYTVYLGAEHDLAPASALPPPPPQAWHADPPQSCTKHTTLYVMLLELGMRRQRTILKLELHTVCLRSIQNFNQHPRPCPASTTPPLGCPTFSTPQSLAHQHPTVFYRPKACERIITIHSMLLNCKRLCSHSKKNFTPPPQTPHSPPLLSPNSSLPSFQHPQSLPNQHHID